MPYMIRYHCLMIRLSVHWLIVIQTYEIRLKISE